MQASTKEANALHTNSNEGIGKMGKFDHCIFIGRFSPFQKAHEYILNEALNIASNVVIVIGSSNTARTVKNPWSADERQEMIAATLSDDLLARVQFIQINDYLYNDNLWVSALQSKIDVATDYSESVALIGFESDETSYYLKLFPQYKYVQCDTEYDFHATQVRDLYFSKDAAYKNMVPEHVYHWLERFRTTPQFEYVRQEKEFIDNYKEQWRGAPYSPTFITADCVVIKSGHILVVTRKHSPGKGLLALPGGFVGQKEKIQEAALRELKEETGIKINTPDLKKCIVESKIFDDPQRSARGRTITNAFLINLGIGPLPQIKAGDDAESCEWLALSDFYSMSDEFFEDHWSIVQNLISKF
jgi:bifunctional NMN adenylyltransferase/nudix hydrolase